MTKNLPRLAPVTLAAGLLLVAIFVGSVGKFRSELRAEIRERIIGRDAAVLFPVALDQLARSEAAFAGQTVEPADLLAPVLESARQQGMLAVTIFDAEGNTLQAVPSTLLLDDLPPNDYPRLLQQDYLSHFYPSFPLDRYFAASGASAAPHSAPVLELLLRLHGRDPGKVLGFAQYYLDARALATELDAIDRRINRLTAATLGVGGALIAAVVAAAYAGLRRAQRTIAERNERLVRANFELTFAAKASAVGQIASHLIHGLQGPVAGLRAVVAERGAAAPEWETAAGYTDRMQTLIQDTVAILGDTATRNMYELTGRELTDLIRDRNAAAAARKGVVLEVADGGNQVFDSHRGSLVCLIANNLVQNALEATETGRHVRVIYRETGGAIEFKVADEGHGIPPEVREHLFEPGRTGRRGSGLGLAISRLLARHIGAELELESTGPTGTTFRLAIAASPGSAPG
jgi:signal transduction histidine kinase